MKNQNHAHEDRVPLLSGTTHQSQQGVSPSNSSTRAHSPLRHRLQSRSHSHVEDAPFATSSSPHNSQSPAALKTRFHEYLVLATALLVALLAADSFLFQVRRVDVDPRLPAVSPDAFELALAVCERNSRETSKETLLSGGPPPSSVRPNGNPRFSALANLTVRNMITPAAPASAAPLLLQHATLWDGVGNVHENTDVAIAYGVILSVSSGLSPADVVAAADKFRKERDPSNAGAFNPFSASDVQVVDVQGKVVSPGLVDMHSHVGVDSAPGLAGTADTNEMAGGPTNPQLRAQDGINPFDENIDRIASGGVTTSLILPGSGTLMGGEGVVIKLLKTSGNSPQDMTLNNGMDPNGEDGKLWRWMKMACGENPKRYFASRGMMPGSRLGVGWKFRERFEKARNQLRAQEDWCETAQALKSQFKDKAHLHISQRYPDGLDDESLVALLRNDVRLQVHCYQTNDIEMMIRNSHEFDFSILAFHHATEAYLVAPKLARENISVAIFADHSLYKREAYLHSVHAGEVLNKAGVKVAFKSDHPVLNAQHLIYEAQKAAHYGLDEQVAFAGVTSVPAERLGAGWRIGRVAVGYDADVLIWDRPPLQLGAHPLRVIIDGYTVFSLPNALSPPAPTKPTRPIEPALEFPASQFPAYTILNCSGIYTQDSQVLKGKIVVENGLVSCIGEKCGSKGVVFNLQGGVVIPGLVAVTSSLGLEEIQQEDGTTDGAAAGSDAAAGLVHAKDGLRVGGSGKLLQYAWKSGVLTGVSSPKGHSAITGVSVAFRTAAERYSEALVKSDVGVHVTIGHDAKDGYAGSVSTQIGRLRQLLAEAKEGTPFGDVVSGKLPLVATAHDPNDISKLIMLMSSAAPKGKLVIAGATGAWVVASELAAANVPVILMSPRCLPMSWERRWCKAFGQGGPTAFEILKAAGVKVSLSITEPDQVRSLLFEAGWATVGDATNGKVNVMDAVGAVTWNVADAFGLEDGTGRISVGKRANLVGLNGGPIGFGYSIQVLGDGSFVTTKPLQD
ncbi:hypothetical protein HDU77_000850 [Chytriomyces hyalinus]|nr:hypothetical protein HDU77_000850 [Chytriomyces hyalinus]